MILSKRSVEMLLDLVESKMSYMDVLDLQDIRDLETLQLCRDQLEGTIDADKPFDELVLVTDAARTMH